MMPMALPHNLEFSASQLAGYSRNRFKLETTSSDTATSGRIVTVNLPQSSIIDLKSFRFFFDADAKTGTASNTSNINGLLPDGAESLISRCEVFINGVQVQQGTTEYNTIARVINLGGESMDQKRSLGRLNRHEGIYAGNGANANVFGGGGTDGEKATLCIDNWKGFLGQCATRFLPTDVLGTIQVRLTFAPDSVLSGCITGSNAVDSPLGLAGEVPPTYSISNMYFTVDTIVVGDAYNEVIRQQMANSYLPLNYKEYYMFINSGISGTSYANRFSLSSGSIDKLYAIQRLASHNVFGQAVDISPSAANISALSAINDEFVGKYFTYSTFKAGSDGVDGDFRYQFFINNVAMPQYLARNSEAMADTYYTNDKVDLNSFGHLITSPTAFCRGCAVYSLQLNHPGMSLHTMSGYNSRGINSFLTFQAQGIDTATFPGAKDSVVIAETMAQLRIKPGRAIAVSF